MRTDRRRMLLLGGGAVAATAAAGGGLGVAALKADAGSWREGVIARIVRERVPDAQVGDADMAAFAQAYLANRRPNDAVLAARALLGPERQRLLPQAVAGQLHKLDNQTVNMFLLATDYFSPDRRGGAVSFVAYPDPYGSGCANPLARFDFPPPDQA